MSPSPRRIPGWLLIVLLPIAAFSIWYGWRQSQPDDSEKPIATPKWKFQSEEHWLVDETARDVAEMLAFAKNPTGAPELTVTPGSGAAPSYQLRARLEGATAEFALEFKEFIWSPADYTAWAKAVLAAWKLASPAPTDTDAAILQTLAEPTPQVLQRESQRLSAALTKAPLDAALHEQAALVTAVFALGEAAGPFSDTRRELCRMTAHLAIARALQPDSSGPVRRIAEAALHTLAGREIPALAILAELDREPSAAGWAHALRLRATGDWRNATEQPALLETLEIFRARTRSVGPDFAIEWLSDRKPAPVHDWRRVVLECDFTVDEGHQFAKDSIPQEIASLQADWAAYFGGKLPDADVLKALDEPAGRSVGKAGDGQPGMRVLGWDLWSAQHQRHLCQSIRATIFFFRDDWGVPEYREVQQVVKKNFAGLTLLPFVEREFSEDASAVPDIGKRASALIESHPELITPSAWIVAKEPTCKSIAPLRVPEPAPWFQPLLPRGTTYDFHGRTVGFHIPGADDTAWWGALLALAPSDFRIRYGPVWKKFGDHPPAAVAEAAYAPLREFHLRALREIAKAQKGKSPDYAATMQRICEFRPEHFFDFGDYFVAQNQLEQAAEAYQKGVDLSSDRVRAANHCGWLVNYLEEHAQPDKALEVAKMAAEVYSHRGLETMARLQEKRGQLKEAEDYWKKIAERYENSTDLLAFCTRHRAENADYEKMAANAERKLFPQGLKKATLAEFAGVPDGGAALVATNENTARYQLKKGDVFVALDGYRVSGRAQYMYVRELSFDDADLRVIVWDGSTYREVEAKLPDRRFGVELSDFKKK